MLSIAAILSVFLIHGISLVSPGPDFLLVLHGALRSKKLGFFLAAGIFFGNFFYISIAGCVSLFLGNQFGTKFFLALEAVGGAYFIFLGYKILSTRKMYKQEDFETDLSYGRYAFVRGFASTALNVKAALYFFSVVPQFINAQNTLVANIVFYVEFLVLSAVWFFGIAKIGSLKEVRVKLDSIFPLISTFTGVIFLVFGFGLAWEFFRNLA